MALFVTISNFLRWNLPKLWQHIESCGIQSLNTKKVGFLQAGFSIFFCKLTCFTAAKTKNKKPCYKFPWKKRAPTKVKIIYYQSVKFPQNFTEGNDKIQGQFCFSCSCWRDKIMKKHWHFPRSACRLLLKAFFLSAYVIVSHLKLIFSLEILKGFKTVCYLIPFVPVYFK